MARCTSVLVVPVAELAKQALGVPFVQNDQVVETLPAEGTDHAPREGVHLRRSDGGADFADAEARTRAEKSSP